MSRQVAARQPVTKDTEENWILARVTDFNAETKEYVIILLRATNTVGFLFLSYIHMCVYPSGMKSRMKTSRQLAIFP
jgi:hypothetical protein